MKKTDLLSLSCPLRIGFGAASLSGEGGGYGFGSISDSEAQTLLQHAFDLGITLYDTAPIYGFGLSEKRLGKTFKNKREKVFFVSKSGVTWHDNKRVNMSNDPLITQKMLEQSLRDLETEYIDLYMIHWPDQNVDIRRPMEILSKAKHEGKIKHIGLCNTYVDDLERAKEIDVIEAVQCSFSFLSRNAKDELFPYLKKNNISFMSYGTLEKGILTQRVKKERVFEASDCRSWAPWWKKSDKDKKIECVSKLSSMAKEHTLLQIALGFVLSYDEVSMALCGARTREQLEGLMKAYNNPPSKENLEKYDICYHSYLQ